MKSALILHGAGNNSKGNWFPWLKNNLEKKGYQVFSSDLPNSDTPIQTDWLQAVKDSGWVAQNDSLIIGHSSGATLILRILEELPEDLRISKSILVAGPVDKGAIEKFWQYKEDLTKAPFNWNKIKKACQEFILIYSDNDPYDCGIRHGELIKEKVGGELVFKKDQGHFNLEKSSSYKSFPEILKYV